MLEEQKPNNEADVSNMKDTGPEDQPEPGLKKHLSHDGVIVDIPGFKY